MTLSNKNEDDIIIALLHYVPGLAHFPILWGPVNEAREILLLATCMVFVLWHEILLVKLSLPNNQFGAALQTPLTWARPHIIPHSSHKASTEPGYSYLGSVLSNIKFQK